MMTRQTPKPLRVWLVLATDYESEETRRVCLSEPVARAEADRLDRLAARGRHFPEAPPWFKVKAVRVFDEPKPKKGRR
jgi:hypothetical protein